MCVEGSDQFSVKDLIALCSHKAFPFSWMRKFYRQDCPDFSGLHDYNPVCQQDGFINIVGNKYHCLVIFCAESGYQLLQLQTESRINGTKRLIQKKNI